MKKTAIISIIIAFVLLVPSPAYAGTCPTCTNTVILNDGYYFETILKDEYVIKRSTAQNTANRGKVTKTKSKTTYLKNAAGKIMWYVKVTGTFTYGNGSAKCIKSVCNAGSKNKSWVVTNSSSSKNGNKASAIATGTHYLNGVPVESLTKIVTLKCDAYGNIT